MNPLRDDLGEATRTIANGKSGWLTDDEGSGFSIRYPSKAAAQLQIDRLARAGREAEEDRAAQRVERLASKLADTTFLEVRRAPGQAAGKACFASGLRARGVFAGSIGFQQTQ